MTRTITNHEMKPVLCQCGCGEYAMPGEAYIKGHYEINSGYTHWTFYKRVYKTVSPPKLCECGCGEYAKPGNRFIFGHYHRSSRDPLPDGWESKLSDITDNKESPVYLGSIAEVILSRIYTNVQVMPYGNPGYDVICNRYYKIDIKASASGDKGYWSFKIYKNQIADYFLFLAFNNRYDLRNPVHLWLIPGHVVNHLSTLKISKSSLDKWRQYELSLDKLRTCCDNLSV